MAPWGALQHPLEVRVAHEELGAIGEMRMFWGVESWIQGRKEFQGKGGILQVKDFKMSITSSS